MNAYTSLNTFGKKAFFLTFCLYSLANITGAVAQLDSTHWIPPMHTRAEPGPQYIYLSTPSIDSIEILVSSGTGEPIMDCNGNAFTSIFISNQSPKVICFRDVDSTQLLIPRGELHQPLRNRGVMLRSKGLFYANVRVRTNNQLQAGSLTSKGSFGKGKIFRTGHLWSNNDPSGNKCHFVSIMATEDNTRVTFNDYDPGVVFENWTGPLPQILLQRGECYLTSVYLNAAAPANDNGIMGMLVESDKDIVINCGSWDGSPNGTIRDIGIDQVTPLQIVGKEYILVRGQGPSTIEYPTIIAHFDNTEIFLSGQAVPYAVIDAGDFLVIPDSEYSPDGNLYIRGSKELYVFQMMGGTGIAQTVGMNFIPPLSCLGQNFVDNIPFIGEIGPWNYTGGLFIVARINSNVLINDLPPAVSSFPVPGNPDYVTYKIISGLSGHVKVSSELPVQVGLFGFNGAAGYGGYYSGFEVVSIDLDLTGDPCRDTLESFTINVDSILWLRNGIPVPGENGTKLKVWEEGSYQVVGFNLGCPEFPDTSRSVDIFLPDSSFINEATCEPEKAIDTTLYLKNIHGCDSIVRQVIDLLPSDSIFLLHYSCEPADTGLVRNVLMNRHGCDSISMIRTELLRSDRTFRYETTCEPEKAGWDTLFLLNSLGCDSIEFINTTLLPRSQDTIIAEICPGDHFPFAGSELDSSGMYTDSSLNRFGCDSVTVLQLTVLPESRDSIEQSICSGDSLLFQGKFYRDSGRYPILLQNRFGCDSLVEMDLTVNPLPIPRITGIKPYCSGDSILIGTGQFPSFTWSTGDTSQFIQVSDSQQLRLEVTNEFGCKGEVTAAIPKPVSVSALIQKDDILCFGEITGRIDIRSIQSGIPPFQIYFEKIPVSGSSFQELPPGSYALQIVDSIGCVLDTIIKIQGPDEALWVDMGPDVELEYGQEFIANFRTNIFPVNSIQWYNGSERLCDGCLDQKIVVTEDLVIRLELTDENGCPASDLLFIKVLKDRNWFVPNAFTPNDDGINDRFTIFGNSFVESIEVLEIYSRWGELLYRSNELPLNDTRYGWDGSFQQKPINPGVFVYRAVLRYKDGNKEHIAGDVTLLR